MPRTKLTEVVRDHDSDSWSQHNPLVAIVRLANLACRVCGVGPLSDPTLLLVATPGAHLLGIKEVHLAEGGGDRGRGALTDVGAALSYSDAGGTVLTWGIG